MNKIYIIVILIFTFFSGFGQKSDFDFKILIKSINIGDDVLFTIKNNTLISYCFLIDKSFSCTEYEEHYYKNAFFSPRIQLYNKGNILANELIYTSTGYTISRKMEEDKELNRILGINRNNCDNFKLFTIKPNQTLHFRFPLNLVNYIDEYTFKYYVLKDKYYYIQINYLQREEFIKQRISKKTQDSISSKKIKFFDGKLETNKVKLKVNLNSYNSALTKLKK